MECSSVNIVNALATKRQFGLLTVTVQCVRKTRTNPRSKLKRPSNGVSVFPQIGGVMTVPQSYVEITESEFEATLEKVADFEKVQDTDASEVVYQINVPRDELVVRIFSTIDGGVSRGCGEDAIRCVLWHTGHDVPVGGKKKTLRIGPTDSNPQGWKGNLVPKIADLLANWREYYHGECHRCNGVMQLREGEYGEFLGCSNYPRCDATRQPGEDPEDVTEEEDDDACPECSDGELVERDGKYGKFLGCTNYPACRHTEDL